MEKRKVSFKDAGLSVVPIRELWGPGRVASNAHTKACEQLFEEECRKRPRDKVVMTIDHASRNVIFEYLPRDFEMEKKLREVREMMERARFERMKRELKVLGRDVR